MNRDNAALAETINAGRQRLLAQSSAVEVIGIIFEIAAAWQANSLALFADVLQEGAETAVTIATWLVMRRLWRRRHQFEHGLGKIESLLGLLIAAGLLWSVFLVLGEVFARLRDPQPLGQVAYGTVMLTAWIAINFWYWRQFAASDRAHPSPLMAAVGKSYAAGTLICTLLTLVLIGGSFSANHPWLIYLDPAASLIYIGFVLYTIYDITTRALADLSDRTLEEALQLVILRALTTCYEDFDQLQGIQSRRSGGLIHVDLLLEFAAERTMGEVYAAGDRITAALQQEIPHCCVKVIPRRQRTP
ncbi:MAG TPA: cation transporter [bacterium]|nr:cation transporter [bacterium]